MDDKLSPKEQVEFMLQRAKMLEEQKKKKEQDIKESIIPVVQIHTSIEEDKQLPDLLVPVTGLSLFEEEIDTQETLMRRFKVDESAYNKKQLTPEKVQKIKKSLGRMTTGVSAAVPIICRSNNCSYSETCLTGDTQILIDDFKYIQLKDINIGDKIYSANDKYVLEKRTVTNKICNGIKTIYTITTSSNKKLKLTANHKLANYFENEVRWLALEDGLQIGHKLLIVDDLETDDYLDSYEDFLLDEIINIEESGLEEVYDIEVEVNHNFIANNMLVSNCVFFKTNTHVEGEPCLAEVYVAEYWTKKYMEDLNIDPNSITEVHTVSRLVEISILENRLTQYMSIHQPDLMMDVVTAVDDEGNEIYNKASSIAFEQRERLDKSKLKILESLAATREKKAKILLTAQANGNENNKNSSLAGIRNSLDALAEDLKRMKDVKTVN